MCEGNFEDSSYRGSRPAIFVENNGDEVEYFRSLWLPEEDSPLGLMAFGLDRELPDWVQADFSKPVLDLGPGRKLIPGAVRIDWPKYDFEPVSEHVHQGENRLGQRIYRRTPILGTWGHLPYQDGTVGGVFAINLLEHLWDPRPLIWEVCRVLAPGAPFTVFVPDGRSPLYAQDLDHKKPFVLDSFRSLLQNPYYAKDHPSNNIKLGWASKFAIKEGNETLLFQVIKGDDK